MAFSKQPPVWRRAFLRALSLGASVADATRHSGIGPRQPYAHRKKNPHFAKLWAEAQKRGRSRLQSGKPPVILDAAPPVRVTIRASQKGRTAIIATAEQCWDEEKEQQFLMHLAATANVTAAALAVGISLTSLYRRRRKWPAFAAAWAQAKADAVDRLDFLLIEAATNLLDPPEVPVTDPVPVSFDQAMKVVQNYGHDTNRRGERKRWGSNRKPRDPDEIRASILRKLDLIEKHERAAQDQREGEAGGNSNGQN